MLARRRCAGLPSRKLRRGERAWKTWSGPFWTATSFFLTTSGGSGLYHESNLGPARVHPDCFAGTARHGSGRLPFFACAVPDETGEILHHGRAGRGHFASRHIRYEVGRSLGDPGNV